MAGSSINISKLLADIKTKPLPILQATTPATFPPVGYNYIYCKSDNKVYSMDSNGNETSLGGSASGYLLISDFNAYSANVSGQIAAISGEFVVGDGIDIQYTPTNYTKTAANISGNLDGINNKFATFSSSQHLQDLAITGRVSTGTFNGSQHAQDLTISGKVATSTFNSSQHLQDLAITGKLATSNFNSYSGNVSGVFSPGDELAITYASTAYTPVTNTISGHFSKIYALLLEISGKLP